MRSASKVITFILDFFFPRSEFEKQIAEITAEELSLKISSSRKADNINAVVLFDYRDELIRQMIWSLKYKRNMRVAKLFAEALYASVAEEFSELGTFSNFKSPILIPIPLSRKRRRERGFNQSELVAERFIALCGDSFCSLDAKILKRVKDTPSQTSLKNKKERMENMKGVFGARYPEKILGQNIVLLDDVTTTGSTLREARKALMDAGAKRVICIAIAH